MDFLGVVGQCEANGENEKPNDNITSRRNIYTHTYTHIHTHTHITGEDKKKRWTNIPGIESAPRKHIESENTSRINKMEKGINQG